MSENLIANLTDPTLWIVVLVWTAIGVINKLIYYEAGERSGKAALEKIHGYTEERVDRFHSQYDRWGSSLLLLASIPVMGVIQDRLTTIPGTVPNLINLPPGCRFAPRCEARIEHKLERCTEEIPELLPVAPNHTVRCWLYQ